MTLASLTLVDTQSAIVHAWRQEFSAYPSVTVVHDSIFNVRADTLVSPANSFGIMDGGLDGQLSSYFGESLERRVRERIKNEFHGELPVGLAITVDTGFETYQRVICAPTMRCPSEVPRSINAYLAMKAILNEAKRHADSMHIAVPGLCSLTGAMSASQVARQMRIAYERVVVGLYPYTHWREEREFESYVRGEISQPPIDLQPYLRPYRP